MESGMKTYGIDHLTPIQKTLLITLKGRSVDAMARKPVLGDGLAAEVARRLDYDLDSVKLSVGTPQGVALRSSVFDRVVATFIRAHPHAVVVELGSGLETRMFRLDPPSTVDWFDVDFPEVIALRTELMPHRANAHPVGASLLEGGWTDTIPADRPTIVVADGLSGFLTEEQNRRLWTHITNHFATGELAFNVYSKLGARMMGRFINSVGIPKDFQGYGIDDAREVLALNPKLIFAGEETIATAPESRRIPGWIGLNMRLNARVWARVPAVVRAGVWVVRYHF